MWASTRSLALFRVTHTQLQLPRGFCAQRATSFVIRCLLLYTKQKQNAVWKKRIKIPIDEIEKQNQKKRTMNESHLISYAEQIGGESAKLAWIDDQNWKATS